MRGSHFWHSYVPESHTVICPGPVLATGNLAFEVEVLDRVILGGGSEAVVPRRLGQALRERPGGEHAVVLEAQIPVQAPAWCSWITNRLAAAAARGLPGGGSGVAAKSRLPL